MAHFAKLNESDVVTQVIVVADEDCNGGVFPESEPAGIAFCQQFSSGTWKQTSYNHGFRARFAGIGYTYNRELDAFIRPSPDPSWILNANTCDWEPATFNVNPIKD